MARWNKTGTVGQWDSETMGWIVEAERQRGRNHRTGARPNAECQVPVTGSQHPYFSHSSAYRALTQPKQTDTDLES